VAASGAGVVARAWCPRFPHLKRVRVGLPLKLVEEPRLVVARLVVRGPRVTAPREMVQGRGFRVQSRARCPASHGCLLGELTLGAGGGVESSGSKKTRCASWCSVSAFAVTSCLKDGGTSPSGGGVASPTSPLGAAPVAPAGFLLSSGTARVELAHDLVFSLSGTGGAAEVGGAASAGYPKSAYCAAHTR
jgi:hypothetical protein